VNLQTLPTVVSVLKLFLSPVSNRTALNMATTRDYTVEKDTTLQYNDIETASQDGKAAHDVRGGDYSGAVAKTDPAEIALVKKLDSRIMPALFCMYFLYVLSVPPCYLAITLHLNQDLTISGTNSIRMPLRTHASTTSKGTWVSWDLNTIPAYRSSTSDISSPKSLRTCSCPPESFDLRSTCPAA